MNARIKEALVLLPGLRGPLQATQYDYGPETKVSYFHNLVLWFFFGC